MTLAELKTRCNEKGFRYAYGRFQKETKLPYLIAMEQDSDNFIADNKVYKKNKGIRLLYYYEFKNLEEQNKIEDEILYDVVWYKTEEIFITEENMWQVAYNFEIKEEN